VAGQGLPSCLIGDRRELLPVPIQVLESVSPGEHRNNQAPEPLGKHDGGVQRPTAQKFLPPPRNSGVGERIPSVRGPATSRAIQ